MRSANRNGQRAHRNRGRKATITPARRQDLLDKDEDDRGYDDETDEQDEEE